LPRKICQKNKISGVSQKAFIFNKENKILAIRRSKTHQRQPLGWDIPGGILEFGEDVKKGIEREIKEETGLDVEELKVIDAFSWLTDANEFWVTIFYTAKVKTGQVILSWEHDAFQWFLPADFLQTNALFLAKEIVKKHFLANS